MRKQIWKKKNNQDGTEPGLPSKQGNIDAFSANSRHCLAVAGPDMLATEARFD